jgi:subtilisin-like proprotein convertase family protein
LSNTPKTIGELMNDPHAILLENALIEIGQPLNFSIPKHLQSQGDPGAYIVQARGPIDNVFRATLAVAGAQIVSYIPNNAYLVRISSGGAAGLAGQPPVQSVIPYEPYYKISSAMIGAAVSQKNLPENSVLTLGLFADSSQQTIDQIKSLGGTVVGTDRSPFGPIVRVVPPANWTALATLPGVQIVELAHRRALANDLARVTLGISTDTVTPMNYMNLSGLNVVVEVNDTGIDQTHPDFSKNKTAEDPGAAPIALGSGRVTGYSPLSLVDTNGHGTHVAGIIAGNGWASSTINNPAQTPQGSVTNADYRGKAPAAKLYSFAALDNTGGLDISDYELQSVPALTNALISNNSWDYDDDSYNLAAASYDAAVRDALPYVTGSQPVLFVFAAGNDGGGDDTGTGGLPDTILSPGTAKNVITVGALEQLRDITNIVIDAAGNSNAVWQGATDSGNEVASYSARGNVGIGTEGAFGRFKPDVVAPGSFVVSTRSAQWDTNAYYNPTNFTYNEYFQQTVQPNTLEYYSITVPQNAVAVNIYVVANNSSSLPFPTNLPIYVSASGFPTVTVNDGVTYSNEFLIPDDAAAGFLQAVQNGGFSFAVGNTNAASVNYDLITEIITTNDAGNYFQVLDGLNETLAPYYRYESGTSMAAPAVSGTLALMQDYFTNTLHSTPSPALLKAMLINGSRSEGSYDFSVTNLINLQGWGLPNLPDILPSGLTNQFNKPCATFFLDQSPTNALATGQSLTFIVTNTGDINAEVQPLRVTLAWTDPPGNPAAAIKLVNNLDLVVTNLDTGDVYLGNDIPPGSTFNSTWDTNGPPNLDAINNVENVFLSPLLGSSYSVTVVGTSVNVNAVTAQTNNVVQDFALVISSGDGGVTNAITVTPAVANPFAGPQVTFVTTTNTLLVNQIAGASTPLLGTNTVGAGAGYATNAIITLGMTNQWHFYVVTNTLGFTNAAFVTVLSQTLATPRMGVFADADQNPTQPEADIDLYVATEPGLTNLAPNVISNCVNGLNGDGASLGNGTGSEFVAYTNSTMGQVYYIGVKSETQEAAEYDFLPVFSQLPFSETDANGNEIVNGLLLPVNIPDGSPKYPGTAYVFALAVQPVQVQDVIVSNQIVHQNFGDLVGVFSHDGQNVVLNNHDSLYNDLGIYNFIYDDSPSPIVGSQHPAGPGSLNYFQGQQGIGPWILTEVDNSLTQTGSVTGLTLLIKPHVSLTDGGVTLTLPGKGFFYGYVDVPAGATNLTIAATNESLIVSPNSGQLFEKLGQQPVPPPTPPTNYDKTVMLTNSGPFGPGGVITIGPSDVPPIQPGRYYVTLYNNSLSAQTYFVVASIALGQAAPVDYSATGPTNLLDDAVMYSSVKVTNTQPIASVSVGLRVDHPRISDLVFHLISPEGTRYLLMENRGGTSTNGCGLTILTTNIVNVASSGGSAANTNYVNVGETSGTLTINYNFYTVPDQMTIYASTNPADFSLSSPTLIANTGFISLTGTLNLPFTTASGYLTIIMNQFGNTNGSGGDAWTYSAGGVQTNFYYLVLTQDTNLTTTPIKFAPPPFVPTTVTNFVVHADILLATNFIPLTNNLGGFETVPAGDSAAPGTVAGWSVIGNQVSVVTDATNAYAGSNFLALANGSISRTLSTAVGTTNILTFEYRGPGIISWWRGENNPLDSLGVNNGTAMGALNYATGEVAQAFSLDGSSSYVQMANSTSLNPAGGFSIEGWIYPTQDTTQRILSKWGDQGSYSNNRSYAFTTEPGLGLQFGFCDLANQGSFAFQDFTVNNVLTLNAWNHVVATYDIATGIRCMYVNGTKIGSHTNTPVAAYSSITPVTIGSWIRQPGTVLYYFQGKIDELSMYGRTLSDSEVNAIYSNGTNGKFNPFQFSASPAQSLAEASVTISGLATNIIFGSNTNWQTNTITFVATNATTPVVITGLEPGMLVDSFNSIMYSNQIYTVTNLVTNAVVAVSNLYYLPEQSLDPLIGTSPYGKWQLEIQDDRVGATNHAVLDSWQLQFVFANTNATPATLPGGSGQTNFVPAGSVAWYQVNVPTNADFATNLLLAASAPVNVWFSTNAPPTIVNPGDVDLIPNSLTNAAVLGTNGSPAIVPGATYYLGVQNTNSFTVNYGVRVDFHLLFSTNVIVPFSIASIVHTSLGGTNGFLLTWFAPSNYLFQVQWTPSLAPANWTPFSNIVGYNASAFTNPTNTQFNFFDDGSQTGGFGPARFYRLILVSSGLPNTLTLPGQTNFNVSLSTPVTVTNTATDSNTNAVLAYSLVNPPAGASISSNGIITWTATPAGLAARFTTVVTDNGAPSASATNTFTIFVAPFPSITNVTVTATNTTLSWLAPTSDQFQMQWATNLAPVINWNTFPGVITSASGIFSFTDTNAPLVMKFYRLLLLP